MTADRYIPQIGDRVRKHGWDDQFWFDVLAVDGDRMWGRHENNTHHTYFIGIYRWVKVEPVKPLPERWLNIRHDWDTPTMFASRASANDHGTVGRIAVLHIWTDADGIDHAEIERVDQ